MSSSGKRVRLGDLLVEEGILTRNQLHRALEAQRASGQFLGEMLVEQNIVSREQLLQVLSNRLEVRACHLRPGLADLSLLSLIGQEEATRLKVLPMFRVRDTLTVAMAEPQSLHIIDRLRELTGCSIRPVLALEGNIVEYIKRAAGSTADLDALAASLAEADMTMATAEADDGSTPDLDEPAVDNPIVNMVNRVLLKAIGERASDVHIEPEREATRIRCRLDGSLRDVMKPPPGLHASIVSRVKVIGRMDIAEKRLPQEGRVRVIAQGREVDLRVSSMPTVLGEKIVIRILDKSNLRVRLEELGFRAETLQAYLRVLRRPYGLVLVTGPTGSGKTTTLYSSLSLIRSAERNIVTVEDPVEYQLDLINQIQVQESIGMTFARALRSILRQDPDVIMVGEIRDEETARVAVQAALTGHLVLATLHTNDAVGAVARLTDMNVEPYLLSSALNGVVAQRLVRTVCSACAEQYFPEKNVLKDAGLSNEKGRPFTRGRGCRHCHESGYVGRAGIYEVMEVTAELRQMIHRGASPQELRRTWQQQGGLTLQQEGVLVALAHRTSLEEVLAATHDDQDDLPGAAAAEPAGEPAAAAVG